MSEAVWSESQDPHQLLAALRQLADGKKLRQRAARRKLRLFAVAQYRRLRPDPGLRARCDAVVRLAERHADGEVGPGRLGSANRRLDEEMGLANTGFLQWPDWVQEPVAEGAWLEAWAALDLAYYASLPDAWEAAEGVVRVMIELPLRRAAKRLYLAEGPERFAGVEPHELDEHLIARVWDEHGPPAQAALRDWLREMFGNPFRPPAVSGRALPPSAVGLAREAYEEQAFDHLGILADALEDAGWEDCAVLAHLREPGPHTRGCWALDEVLARA